MKAQPSLTDEQAQIIRDILAEALKNVPEQIYARLGEAATLVAGVAVGAVLLSESISEVIPMAICPNIDPQQREALVRFVCGDVGRALSETSERGNMSARESAPSHVFSLRSVVKGRA